jgi:hypothetical protein
MSIPLLPGSSPLWTATSFQLNYSRVRVILRLAVYRQSVLAISPLIITTSNFILLLNTCGYSPYVTSSLTSGWVCRLQLLMALPAQSLSGPSPAGLMTTFYCLRLEPLPAWRARSPYLYLPGTGWPGYTHRHWVPFPLPLTTHWAMVEKFEPASTWLQLSL